MSNFKYYWLRTNDKNYVVIIPALATEDVVVFHMEDAPSLRFDLTCTLSPSVREEVSKVCDGYGVEPKFDAMAITWRQA